MAQRLHLTKMFEERRIATKVVGSPPGTWDIEYRTPPLAEAVDAWLRVNEVQLVSVTAPGFHVQWLNSDRSAQQIIAAVMVVYEEGGYGRDTGDAATEPNAAEAERYPEPEPAYEGSDPLDP